MTAVVGTSAISAVPFGEAERAPFYRLLETRPTAMPAGNVVELARAVARRAPRLIEDARLLLQRFGVAAASVDEIQVGYPVEGQARFGRGRGHVTAVLSFGDLFAHALARHLNAPLLFKGDGFRHTDVKVAL